MDQRRVDRTRRTADARPVKVRHLQGAAGSTPPPPTGGVDRPAPKGAAEAAARLARRPELAATAPSVTVRRSRLDHLTSGRAFDAKAARALQAITGQAISADGLTRLYEKALPTAPGLAPTRVRLTGAAEGDHFAFTVTWVDNLKQRIATARRRLVRHEDGSLELYRHGTWLDQDQRGRGFAAQVLRAELGLLLALGDHPEDKLTLWAGGARDPKGRGLQSVGTYLWAKAGFDVAEAPSALAMSGDKPRCEDDPGPEALSDFALMQRQLGDWVASELAAGTLSAEAADRLRAASTPHAIAQLEGGKAFLLSDAAPRWAGTLSIRDEAGARGRVDDYIRQAGEAAAEAGARIVSGWQDGLRSDTVADVKAALEAVGRHGGVALAPDLEAVAARWPDLADQVRATQLKIRGRYRPPRPKVTYVTRGGRTETFSLPPAHADLQRMKAPKLASIAVGDEDFRRAQAALQQLAGQHLDKAPKLVLEAAEKVYARFADDEERWLTRQAAVRVLERIPDEAGIPALVKASKTEDEINVMVAIHRALDTAEHPSAVVPGEKLEGRIERMKEEIERALAEL